MASLRFNGAKIWNSMDESIEQFSKNKFKKQLKPNMINCYKVAGFNSQQNIFLKIHD